MKFFAVLCLLTAAAVQVYAFPGGAPVGACATITPVGHISPGLANTASPPNPFALDVSGFPMCPSTSGSGGGYCYCPGEQYTMTLSGGNMQPFRGFLVQGRLVADRTTPTGAFSNFGTDSRASDCMPTTSAVTHVNPSRTDRTTQTLTWTAPAAGTGPIYFQSAVVVRYTPGTLNQFYAPFNSMDITEAPATTCGACFTAAVSFWVVLALLVTTFLL